MTDGTDGVVERQGYYFKMILPDDTPTRPIGFVAEAATGGNPAGLRARRTPRSCGAATPGPSSVRRPATAHSSSTRPDATATLNNVAATSYNGTQTVPTNDAAFSVASDMGAELGLAIAGLNAQSGVWTPVGN